MHRRRRINGGNSPFLGPETPDQLSVLLARPQLGRSQRRRPKARAFALENEEDFVHLMLEEIPDPPLDAAQIRATNLGLDPA